MTEVKLAQLICISFTLVWGVHGQNVTCATATPLGLIQALDRQFNKTQVIPSGNYSEVLKISIDITVVAIIGVDEKSQILSTVIWQVLEWDIAGLSWDIRSCGTNRTSVLRKNLWVPDVYIAEFTEEDKSYKPPYVYLYNNGHVYDDKPLKVDSSCRLVTYTFPFDIQNCTLTFGSYLHFDADVRMDLKESAEEMFEQSTEVLRAHGEWELVDIAAGPSTQRLQNLSYSEIKFQLILRRRPLLYVVNLLVPSCFLVMVDLFSFLLPPQTVDRSAFKMTLILGYTVFLLIMNDLLPITGDTTPLINVFFSISIALMVASLLQTLFITNLQCNSSRQSSAPRWLRALVLRYLAVVVCLPANKRKNLVSVLQVNANGGPAVDSTGSSVSSAELHCTSEDPAAEKATDPALEELRKLSVELAAIRRLVETRGDVNTPEEWVLIGLVLDRLLFGIYVVFITVSFLVIIIIWTWNSSYSRNN